MLQKKRRKVRDGDQLYIGIRSRDEPEFYARFQYRGRSGNETPEFESEYSPKTRFSPSKEEIIISGGTNVRDLVRISRSLLVPEEKTRSHLRDGDAVTLSTIDGDVILSNSEGVLILGTTEGKGGSHIWILRKKTGSPRVRYGDTVILSPPGGDRRRWCFRGFLYLGDASLSSLFLQSIDHVLPPPPPRKEKVVLRRPTVDRREVLFGVFAISSVVVILFFLLCYFLSRSCRSRG